MAAYRFLFADLVTNAILTELPLKRVSFTQKLNDVGTFSGVINISDPNVAKLKPWSNTQPGRTALYVDTGGRLVWGGIVVTRRYHQVPTGQTMILEVGASEFMWYFRDKRVIAVPASFTNVDQLTIAQSLINTAQGVTNGNIGVSVPSNTSGILRTQTWNASDRKKVGQALIEMSQLDQGFDWRINVDYGIGGQAAGVPGKQLLLGYPRLGAAYTSTGWVFEFPGNVVGYVWPEDASLQAITAYVQGAGTGTTMVQSSNTVTSLLDGGYPQLDEVFRAKDQTDASVIAARAVAAAKAYSSPVTLPQLTVRANVDPILGSYTIGDDTYLRITSPQFPASGGQPGYMGYWRIVELRVQPQDDGMPERVTLTLGAPPV